MTCRINEENGTFTANGVKLSVFTDGEEHGDDTYLKIVLEGETSLGRKQAKFGSAFFTRGVIANWIEYQVEKDAGTLAPASEDRRAGDAILIFNYNRNAGKVEIIIWHNNDNLKINVDWAILLDMLRNSQPDTPQ
ncbi:hypothetical protein JW758_01365 [Candidatus Peregrinibacteria bacterium]|nr:hypothetical protein [Candidatus Peregrinibacteria bacterium]